MQRRRANGKLLSMLRRPVDSSVLVSVGYDPTTRTLEVELIGGAIYRYFDVPEIAHRRLLAAPSLGRHFNAEIRDGYRSTRGS